MARRFILSRSSGGFLSLVSWISILGVLLGVLALVVVTSVVNGFEGEMGRIISGVNGDVFMYSRGNPIGHPEDVQAKIEEVLPNLEATTATFFTEIMVAGPGGVAGALLEGIDEETFGKVTTIPKRIVEGQMPLVGNEIAIGWHLAQRLGIDIGDRLRLVAPFIGEGQESLAVEGVVVGIIRVGLFQYDSKYVYAPLGQVQKFLRQPDKVTNFKMRLQLGADLPEAVQRLRDNFGYPLRAKHWGQLDQNFFQAVRHEKLVISIILAAILVVAAFNVISSLMMMIYDKTQEISILKAMGFRPSQSFWLFCGIGSLIGLVGVGAGSGLGLALNRLIANVRIIDLPEDVYRIGFLPVVERWGELSVIIGLAFLICFLATLYPAWKVKVKSPLDGLRHD